MREFERTSEQKRGSGGPQLVISGGANRYRYQGKERDLETGLDYYGYRYLCSWLGRWTCPDPGGTVDGLNLMSFVGGDPVGKRDGDGRQNLPIAQDDIEANAPDLGSRATSRLRASRAEQERAAAEVEVYEQRVDSSGRPVGVEYHADPDIELYNPSPFQSVPGEIRAGLNGVEPWENALEGDGYLDFEYRQSFQINIPLREQDIEAVDGWTRSPDSESAYHRYGFDETLDVSKWTHEDGREAVYVRTELLTDTVNRGTYNFGSNARSWAHIRYDVSPFWEDGYGLPDAPDETLRFFGADYVGPPIETWLAPQPVLPFPTLHR